jgi:hypothetical protein
LLHAAVPLGAGRQIVHILIYYGFSGARSGHSVAQALNEDGITQVLRLAAAFADEPVIVASDFNDCPESSAALAAAIQTGEWTDLAMAHAEARDTVAPPTSHQAGAASRLDLALGNPLATVASAEAHTADIDESDLPGHLPVFFSFRWAQLLQKFQVIHHPRAFPRPVEPLSREQLAWRAAVREEISQRIWEEAEADWDTALQHDDVETLRRIWCTTAETTFLRTAVDFEEEDFDAEQQHKYRGRGMPARLKWRVHQGVRDGSSARRHPPLELHHAQGAAPPAPPRGTPSAGGSSSGRRRWPH